MGRPDACLIEPIDSAVALWHLGDNGRAGLERSDRQDKPVSGFSTSTAQS